MRHLTSLLALSMLSALLPSCTNNCTLIGCGPAVLLVIGSEEAPLDPSVAAYQVDLDLDGQSVVLTCATGATQCEVEGDEGKFWVEGLIYPDELEIDINGREELAPALIEVYVLAGENQVHESTLSPEYTDQEINGKGCGVCRSAEEAITLPGS